MHAVVGTLVGGVSPESCAVLVPSAAAARELRRTLVRRDPTSRVRTSADFLTRAEFYDRLHRSYGDLPRLLSVTEREVLLRRAARKTAAEVPPPFSLRAGLLREMLRFYDELRRREQSLDDFGRKVTAQLAYSADFDRGAERLLRQTEFLAAAYREFERLSNETDAIDEHGLRSLLLAQSTPSPYGRVVVTVGDQASDSRGLFPSDFDLLSRLRGVERLDVVATENLLASGFHERIHDLLPGIEEERCAAVTSHRPTLAAPPAGDADRRWFTCRDREEELADVVRDLKYRAATVRDQRRCAIVFQRPLPYLYLARQVFSDAGISYQSFDGLPLSGEPFAAAVDLVLSFLSAEGNRASTIALLSSPHFDFGCDRKSVARSGPLDARLKILGWMGPTHCLRRLRPRGAGSRGRPIRGVGADPGSRRRLGSRAARSSCRLHSANSNACPPKMHPGKSGIQEHATRYLPRSGRCATRIRSMTTSRCRSTSWRRAFADGSTPRRSRP